MIPYDQALTLLYGRINYERQQPSRPQNVAFKLERMQRLLSRIGNPQQKLPAVHIAGTKGKGSTAIMTASILQEAGYQVGLFTSPHVSRFEERMRVNGVLPTTTEFAELFSEIWPHIEEMDRLDQQWAPTFFEIATALAWLYFFKKQVEIVVLEVGLGGRLDATNLCQPIITMITNISYDHTNLLGNTLGEIAAEKAGIIKSGVPLITAAKTREAQRVILHKADQLSAKTYLLDRDFQFDTHCTDLHKSQSGVERPQWRVDVRTQSTRWNNISIPLAGEHQACNLAMALQCIELLETKGWKGLRTAVNEGVQKINWPLRCEQIGEQPLVIIDAAHNAASVQACLNALTHYNDKGNRILIFSATREKDVEQMMTLVKPHFHSVIFTSYLTNPRAVPICELTQIAHKLGYEDCSTAETPVQAWQQAQKIARKQDLICITGSFFLAAELREIILAEPAGNTNQTVAVDALSHMMESEQSPIT